MSLKLNNNSTSGLMVKLAVAIGQLRVRFAASASSNLFLHLLFAFSFCEEDRSFYDSFSNLHHRVKNQRNTDAERIHCLLSL
jgi:hypothetical protein